MRPRSRYPVSCRSAISVSGGHPSRLGDVALLGASVRLSWPLLSQSCISGGFTDTGVCDRLNLSRLGLGDTLNLTSLQTLGGDTLDDLSGVGAAPAATMRTARGPGPLLQVVSPPERAAASGRPLCRALTSLGLSRSLVHRARSSISRTSIRACSSGETGGGGEGVIR